MQQEQKYVVAGDVLFPEGGDQLSANGKQALNQYVPKLRGLPNANDISPPSSNPPACGGGKGRGYRPRRTMLWQRAFATTAGGTAGAQQPPAASPPPGRCRRWRPSASRPGIEEDAVAILQVWDDRGGAADDRPTAGPSNSG